MIKTDFEYSMDLEAFIDTIVSFINMPYIWAGDDFSGYDCSGSVIESLKSIGYIDLKDDFTANGLWKRFKDYEDDRPIRGSLIFWFDKDGKAYHIAVCENQYFCITADGGSSKVKTVQDAIKYNAFIKRRRIDHRGNVYKIINLFRNKPNVANSTL